MENTKIIGIDYGSNLAGTTVICYSENRNFSFLQSKAKANADNMIINTCMKIKPDYVFIDAPLSLPESYFEQNPVVPDYFFRKCDRLLKAMSPMFLGGLTARAIQLKYHLNKQNIGVYETYPARQAEELQIKNYKKKEIAEVVTKINESYDLSANPDVIINTHQLDALLAYIGGIRFLKNISKVFGSEKEGLIYI